MDSLFDLGMPWWEFVIRATAVYVVVLLMVRITGKRAVGQFTPFDMLLIVLLGTAVQNSLIGDDVSLVGGLILAATLLALNWLVGALTARHPAADRWIEGEPVVLARDGQVFWRVLRRENVSRADFDSAKRSAECSDDAQIEIAVLETSGQITVIKRRGPSS
ncbi:MAG TPA: YetF domain-containing protein [Pseudoxanthomonas sp.]|nr:YetF domain-containing protein [Pseudoxanthomonas sp.]